MKVLVACEESQAVCKALRARGHEAYSCDIVECSGGHPEWHIRQDVIPLLNGRCRFRTDDGTEREVPDRWDMIIAFPPCTYTSNAGAKHLFRGHRLNLERFYKGLCGKALFETIRRADCDRISVENPTPSRIYGYDKPTQTIQPYEYGHPWSKRTNLWLKGLPKLAPTSVVQPECGCHEAGTWFMRGGAERQKNRSKLCEGFAEAMADQWGALE